MIEIPNHLSALDLLIIISYFLLVLFVTLMVVLKGRGKTKSFFEDSEDYFLGGDRKSVV